MASHSANQGKRLTVFGRPGVGKTMLMGNLIYKCGGIDMLTMERLERAGINRYDKAVRYIKEADGELYFYTPKGKVTFVDQGSVADGVILVIEPEGVSDQIPTEPIRSRLEEFKILFSSGKAIIVVNKLDRYDWAEDLFDDCVASTRTALKNLEIDVKSSQFVPVSGQRGDNLIKPYSEARWYIDSTQAKQLGTTLLDVIDAVYF